MRTVPLLLAVLVLTAGLSGCGGDDEPDAQATRSATATPNATSTAESPRPSADTAATASAGASATASATASTSASVTASSSPPSSAATTTRTARATPSAPTTPAPAVPPQGRAAQVRLTGNGLDLPRGLLEFGADYEQARPVLDAALGGPTTDTGVTDSFSAYGTCPGTQLRALEYSGGALVVLFGDVGGPGLRMYQWALTSHGSPSRVPRASALVGDAATFDFGVGTTVAELQQGARPAAVQVNPGDEVVEASFRLQDQSPGFFGRLTGTGRRDTATFVQGGEGCGE